MKFREVIRKRLRHSSGGIHLSADINAVISANVGEKAQAASTRSRQRIVQRSRASAAETREDDPKGG
jgi:hypothetical protein